VACYFSSESVAEFGGQWNFEKFLIDKEGNVVNRWASTTTPAAIDVEVGKLL
jgi:glutathione peroxidase